MTGLERLKMEYGRRAYRPLEPGHLALVMTVGEFIVEASELEIEPSTDYHELSHLTHRHWMARE